MNRKFILLAAILFIPIMGNARMVNYSSDNLKIDSTFGSEVPEIPESMKQKIALDDQEFKTKGYVDKNLATPKKMLDMTKKGVTFVASKDPEDTHLKKDISEIKLAFPYTKKTANPIGFAPIMMYKDNGWTGIKEFFKDEQIGTCSLSTANRVIAQGKVYLQKDSVSYEVNEKPTTIYVEGNNNTGFLYSVHWYDNIYNKYLDCANMIYDKEITNKMIVLAKQLDKK